MHKIEKKYRKYFMNKKFFHKLEYATRSLEKHQLHKLVKTQNIIFRKNLKKFQNIAWVRIWIPITNAILLFADSILITRKVCYRTAVAKFQKIFKNLQLSSSHCLCVAERPYSRKPALGRCWAFVPSVRLLLSSGGDASQLKGDDTTEQARTTCDITATLLKTPRSEGRSTVVRLSSAGFHDVT